MLGGEFGDGNESELPKVKVPNGDEFPTSSAFRICRAVDEVSRSVSRVEIFPKLSTASTAEFGKG